MRKRALHIAVVAVAAAGSLLVARPAEAATIELSTAQSRIDPGTNNQGWWTATGPANLNPNDNYVVGEDDLGREFRDFFTFDLRLIPSDLTVVGATLRVNAGFSTAGDLTETVGFFDVSTDGVTLNRNTGTNEAIFADLGTGRSYGTFPVNRGSLGDLSFVLNADAVADINAARSGFFSLGGRLLSFSRPDAEFVFGGTGGLAARLIVEAFPLPRTSQECKGGGWRNLTDEVGEPFTNQGRCIVFARQHPKR
ncbi:MAG: hypothetical protein ACRDZ0_02310 [Acidimicrobiales bacterium]